MFKLNRGNRLSLVPPLLSKRSRSRLSKPPPSARGHNTESQSRPQSVVVSADDDINGLVDKFKDPTSPFYIAPGTAGPAHENDHSTSRDPAGQRPLSPATPLTPTQGPGPSGTAQKIASSPTDQIPPLPSPSDTPKPRRSTSAASLTHRPELEGRARAPSTTSHSRTESTIGRQRGASITSKVELVPGMHSRKASASSLHQRTISVGSMRSQVRTPVVDPSTEEVLTSRDNGSETLAGHDSAGHPSRGPRPPVAGSAALAAASTARETSFSSSSAAAFGVSLSAQDSLAAKTSAKQAKSREAAFTYFKENGYDDIGVLEWPVAWGDCDMFQHANNVQYIRWFESSRIKYGEALAPLLPEGMMKNMLRGTGNGIILKDVSLRYRMPVTYPDTLLIASKPHSINQERGSYGLAGAFWSMKTGALVATGDSTIVFYDYDHLKKGFMPDTFRDVLFQRAKGEGDRSP
ncbi:hypothetical protein BD324DRAFT_116254 [Kockovaella imperatae]|uniref:HotDog domain-containing protein n=1 Tax=Kockovaella imperatae TaxID=4999 RepID=A0A1Y1UC48_9TREE|nr:hypothetical protein BD324DRAFT_116254 [Kockovaella imperatae]ORX35066.1 hypothetical protein BD324DRAFT_116254 [Kockovaella imperatae]